MSEKKEISVEEPIVSYKGFDKDFKCRGYQYEVGETYTHNGEVVACPTEADLARGAGGFHACEHPLNVFSYYGPASSRYALVEQTGEISCHDSDTKIASATITIKAELQLPELIQRAVDWVFARAKWSEGPVATNDNEGCTASGRWGAATASGDQGAATASGRRGAATASGNWAVACGLGYASKARASEGSAIVLCHRNYDYQIVHIRASKVGENGIKPDTWYRLDEDGEFVECGE